MILLVPLILFVAAAGLLAGAFYYIDAGYVLLSFYNYTLETSLWLFLVLLAGGLIALYWTIRFILIVLQSDGRFFQGRQ